MPYLQACIIGVGPRCKIAKREDMRQVVRPQVAIGWPTTQQRVSAMMSRGGPTITTLINVIRYHCNLDDNLGFAFLQHYSWN